MNDQGIDPRNIATHNPYHLLFSQLTGSTSGKPRQKTAMNIWRRTHAEKIEAEVKRRALEQGTSKKGLAALREKVAKELFALVDPAERDACRERALEEHAIDMAQWKKSVLVRPSTEPADRHRWVVIISRLWNCPDKPCHRCIHGLAEFIKPILDGIHDATGWEATFIAGGPDPAHDDHFKFLRWDPLQLHDRTV